jgi:hypothetical protein
VCPAQPADPFPGLLAKVSPASCVAFLTLFSMAYNIVPMFAVSDQIGAEPTDYAGQCDIHSGITHDTGPPCLQYVHTQCPTPRYYHPSACPEIIAYCYHN